MLRARNVVAQCLESVLRVVKASLLFSGRSEMLMFHIEERVPTLGPVLCCGPANQHPGWLLGSPPGSLSSTREHADISGHCISWLLPLCSCFIVSTIEF